MKYKLGEKHPTENLYRIVALKDFANIKEGTVGGWVKGEHNLAQEGNCWVYGDARVYEDAWVYGDARVYGDALVSGGVSPKREWVGLTDEDLSVCDEDGVLLARYWENKLKEKNT